VGKENAPVTNFTFEGFLGKFRGEGFGQLVHHLRSSLDFETSQNRTSGSFRQIHIDKYRADPVDSG
jgi:hypothetical protein